MLNFERSTIICTGAKEWISGTNAATLHATTDNESYVVYLSYNDSQDNIFYINFGEGPAAFYMAREFYDAVLSYLTIIMNGFRFEIDFMRAMEYADLIPPRWESLYLNTVEDHIASSELMRITNIIEMYRKNFR